MVQSTGTDISLSHCSTFVSITLKKLYTVCTCAVKKCLQRMSIVYKNFDKQPLNFSKIFYLMPTFLQFFFTFGWKLLVGYFPFLFTFISVPSICINVLRTLMDLTPCLHCHNNFRCFKVLVQLQVKKYYFFSFKQILEKHKHISEFD